MAIWKSLTLNLHRFFAQKPISLKAMLNGKTSQLNDAEIKVTPKNTIEHTKDNRISFEPFEVFVGNLA